MLRTPQLSMCFKKGWTSAQFAPVSLNRLSVQWFIAQALTQMPLCFFAHQRPQIRVVDAEDAEDLGLVLEIVQQRIAQTGDFGVVESQRVGLVRGDIMAVKDFEIDFGGFVEAGDVDEDLVALERPAEFFAKNPAELDFLVAAFVGVVEEVVEIVHQVLFAFAGMDHRANFVEAAVDRAGE